MNFVFGFRASVSLLGIVGNAISFAVFSRQVFANNSISVYCRALAIFNSFTIVQIYVDVSSLFGFYPQHAWDAVCKIFIYTPPALSSIPAWILVAFALDKLLTMKKSQRFDFVKKRWFQMGFVAAVALIHVLAYSEILVLLNRWPDPPNSTDFYCLSANLPGNNIIGAIYLLEASLVPFAIMFTSSLSIYKMLKMSRRRSIGDGMVAAAKRRKSRDIKFAVTSLTFNVLFIVLKLPFVMYYVFRSFGLDLGTYFFDLASILFFVNASISFLVYYVSNSIFRNELFSILMLNKRNQIEAAQSTVINVRPIHTIEK